MFIILLSRELRPHPFQCNHCLLLESPLLYCYIWIFYVWFTSKRLLTVMMVLNILVSYLVLICSYLCHKKAWDNSTFIPWTSYNCIYFFTMKMQQFKMSTMTQSIVILTLSLQSSEMLHWCTNQNIKKHAQEMCW